MDVESSQLFATAIANLADWLAGAVVLLVLVGTIYWLRSRATLLDQEKEKAETSFRRFVETCQEGVWIFDSALQVTWANQQVEEILGIDACSTVGTPLLNWVHAADRNRAMGLLNSAGRGVPGQEELRFVHADGSEIWTLLGVNRLSDAPADDSNSKCLAMMTDITRRRRAERNLLSAQKLESLGALTGGIAHDFNNLLMVILSNLDLARTVLEDDSPGQEFLVGAENAATRAAALSKQMLAYAGKQSFDKEEVHLERLLKEMQDFLAVSVKIPVKVHAPSDSLSPVLADPAQLRQVFLNLLLNAAAAMEDNERGRIEIRISEEWFDRARLEAAALCRDVEPGPFVVFHVQDSGSGIEPRVMPKIFDPYFTTKASGRGLGLAAVAGIALAHGAALEVDSQLGRGTTFRFALPALDLPAAEPLVYRNEETDASPVAKKVS